MEPDIKEKLGDPVPDRLPQLSRFSGMGMTRPHLIRSLSYATLAAPVGLLMIWLGSAAWAGDGCRQGFVWREAFSGDHVCVRPAVRAQARDDNSQAPDRVNPDNRDFGPDTCRYGFVWREADSTDHVCVTPYVRAETRQDNALAPGRFADARGGDPETTPRDSYNHAWQAAPGDTSCCPDNMLVCPAPRRFCASNARPASRGNRDGYNPAWQAAPGDTRCCPNSMLVCPTPRQFCRR
jgi:hypothetical protein